MTDRERLCGQDDRNHVWIDVFPANDPVIVVTKCRHCQASFIRIRQE